MANSKGIIVSVTGVMVGTLTLLLILSFDTLEYQQIGLNYSWLSQAIENKTYHHGRRYIGITNNFIKFPRMVRSMYFVADNRKTPGADQFQGPSLHSRTNDGLDVTLEVSLQYQLKPEGLFDLYTTLGAEYQTTLVRMAIEQITTSSTKFTAQEFFTDRTVISEKIHSELQTHFETRAYSKVPFFQLRTVHLPTDFETAIRTTQVKQQEIEIAKWEQHAQNVTFQTKVLQSKKAVEVLFHNADAQAQSIHVANEAYCNQYTLTQELQATALKDIVAKSGWNQTQLLDYLRIRAVRQHPSSNTFVRW